MSSAKLGPPVQRTAEVRRTGIADRLARAGSVKLVLVRAPAGFGKTTAMVQLRELLEERGSATGWLVLDRADNDVPRFLSGLSAAAAHMGVERRNDTPEGILDLLAAETAPYALFLDDFELIREGGVMALIRELIDNLPRNGLLVIGSRSVPDLGLGRLRARGQLLELDTNVLRFSPAESEEFFRLRGAGLSLEAVDRAHGKTEGWVAALWLLALALQRDGSRSSDLMARLALSDRDVAEYLTEEVLTRQDPPVRDFLLRTSVLKHLSAPACQALLPHTDCAAMLQQLERTNVFLIPVEDAPGLYRYHSLFADFLRDQLAKERPDEIARLHLAASGWYEAEGRAVPAIDHAIEGGDHPHALHLLESQAETLLEQGRMRLLDRWCSAIPPDLLREKPLMQLVAVWARCFTQGPWTAMEWLQASGCADSPAPGVQAHVRALLPILLAMMDRYDDAHQAGREGLQHLPTGNAFADSVLLNAMAHIVSVAGARQEAHSFLDDARRSQGASGFTVRGTMVSGVGMRMAVMPMVMSAQMITRDRGFTQRVFAMQNIGRRIVSQQRTF
ncbi:MAG: helix-turn-helix transcriptional regulator, partial [Pseudomonadota bacterium]